MNIRVLIIDDHPLAREGLVAALGRDPGIEVVGQAESGEEGVRLAAELRPSVVTLDLHLVDMDGVEALAGLRENAPDARALIVTASEQIDSLVQAMAAGAAGYLSKRATPEEIRQAVIDVHGGGSVISPMLAGHLLRQYTRIVQGDAAPSRSLLTAREEEILRLLAQGHTDSEIADQLYLSRRTVQYHLASVRRKTGLSRRSQLARWVGEHAS
jgi:DNA-binding NarL/FixJ family response regulator